MILRERQNRIISALRAEGAASVRELAAALDVSEATIRRDLEVLDRNGELTRTYGGAVLKPGTTVEDHGRVRAEGPFDDGRDLDLKERMAEAAAAMVTDGNVVLLDIGTTTPLLARRLHGRDVTVVTSNLAVFDELRDDRAVRLVLLGGVVRRNYRTLVGSLAELALSQISADVLFLSCTGVRANGHVVDNMAVEAPIKQSMIAASDKVVLLASEAKFPGTGALRLCSLTDVDALVTTTGAPDDTLALCRNAGGEVTIA
ncbi:MULTISPECIES: DeoR/GlpR family DNA-binding transcription regulator [unclassified Curtobacterium]|uniref:DeoR/GlpR family DNA-binding transcription regulator n=1 Tax=unclassified Curtobacterium TaxID=257496 RepID=UPI000DA930B0|nr:MULTISPECIES: DeoR/GlpR family DNA-binding transcription regulator [unclassified Curtobacterium]PZE26057.1 ArsR family transcriptional regulator [Curtobacterium sp. MCBD17_028]PZE77739.1 ArsR family transcriptional regulator [Curtobacterium sp. MCBD17_019]WIE54695.1 DeoR/GlpR family DNA-binding transcription regulator [Curtobacterium sp. MCBD17_003]